MSGVIVNIVCFPGVYFVANQRPAKSALRSDLWCYMKETSVAVVPDGDTSSRWELRCDASQGAGVGIRGRGNA